MNSVRRKIPSPLSVYNTYYLVYFKYFYGHARRRGYAIPDNLKEYLDNFVQVEFEKLHYSLKELENYLLWAFSKYGNVYLRSIHSHLNEYSKVRKTETEIKPFALNIIKYMRDKNLSWEQYISSSTGLYPPIIQHYMKDKNFPFEVILYLGILDSLKPAQSQILKSVFGKELYNKEEKLLLIGRNQTFIESEIKRIKEMFDGKMRMGT